MVAALVRFPHLSEAASLTADRDQSHTRGSSPLPQHLATLSWQPPCESNDFCQTFQEMQKLEVRKGRQPFVFPPGDKDPSQNPPEPGFPGSTPQSMILLSAKVAKVIHAQHSE